MKRIFYIIIIVVFFAGNLRAQNEFGHVTPTTADFTRYGEVPVSLFTGKMNLDVPIYRIKDNDFDIPISLTYTSDGFKPSKRSGFVGLDWFLNGGGCITREVYGSPDETTTNSLDNELGYLSVIQQGAYDKDKIWDFDPSVVLNFSTYFKYLKLISGYYCDYRPDLFQFNFNGHSGQFMINNEGGINSSNKGYKIDITNLTIQNRYEQILPEASSIQITTPDGYKYIFGGELSSLEFSINFTQGQLPIRGQTNPTILAWHLTSVIAPNGHSVSFIYKTVNLSDNDLNNTSPIWSSSKTSTDLYPKGSAIKNVVLDKIEIDDMVIYFDASAETMSFNSYPTNQFNPGYSDFNYACYQLDDVRVKVGDNLLYSYHLNYAGLDKRRFLSDFTTAEGSQYIFNYYQPASYPQPDVNYTDYWGYWNANNNDHSYSLLKEVIYPTKGYSSFFYETHKNKSIVKISFGTTPSTYMSKQLVDESIIVGGARISKIQNFSSSGVLASEKQYIYTSTKTSTSSDVSSGILYQYPPIYYDSQLGQYASISNWQENYNISESHIGYSTVFETLDDNSYIKYKFSDYVDNPDVDTSKIEYISSTYNILTRALTSVNRIMSNSKKRGLLSAKIIYDKDGIQKQKSYYYYQNVGTGTPMPQQNTSTDYIVAFRTIDGGCMANKIVLQSYPKVIQRDTIDNIATENLYSYNNYDLISSEETKDSKNNVYLKTYKYLSDDNLYSSFTGENFLNYMTESSEFKNTQRIKTIKKSYYTFPNSFPLVETSNSYIGNQVITPNNVIVYNKYNERGYPEFITTNEINKVVYLWGNSGDFLYKYPFAKIEGVSYSDVSPLIGIGSPFFNNLNQLPDLVGLEYIRNGLADKKALVTTFTFIPFIGVNTLTDPRGVTTTYTYDSFNRLQYIKDTNGKILKNYDYHYKQ